MSGHGTLYSYADYRRAMSPEFMADIPYLVGLIELDEGPRMYGRLAGSARPEDIGQPVTTSFQVMSAEVTRVAWRVERANSVDIGVNGQSIE